MADINNNKEKDKYKNVEQREHMCTVGGNVYSIAIMENSMEVPFKIKNRTAI